MLKLMNSLLLNVQISCTLLDNIIYIHTRFDAFGSSLLVNYTSANLVSIVNVE